MILFSRFRRLGHYRAILRRGADIDARSDAGSFAAMYSSPQAIQTLIEAGAQIEALSVEDITPLLDAAASGPIENLRALIEAGADARAIDTNRESALHRAVHRVASSHTQLLIQAGAVLEARDCNGETPLHLSARDGSLDNTRAILAAGADIEAKGDGFEGATALHIAACNNNWKCVQLLLNSSADIEVSVCPIHLPLHRHRVSAILRLPAMFCAEGILANPFAQSA